MKDVWECPGHGRTAYLPVLVTGIASSLCRSTIIYYPMVASVDDQHKGL